MHVSDRKIYEGKAKILNTTDDPTVLEQFFKDDATAFNGLKKAQISGKGIINCRLASELFQRLEAVGIDTHFIEQTGPRTMRVKRAQIVPLEVVARNVVAGSLAKRLGLPEGATVQSYGAKHSILELYYKRDDLNDPLINEDHALAFGYATAEELLYIKDQAHTINQHLSHWFLECGITLVDFKLEFGRTPNGIVLADEISPDGARLWDSATQHKLDKDRFRRDLGQVEDAYLEVLKRVCGEAVQQEVMAQIEAERG